MVADCVGQCEEKNAAYNYGPTTPVHVTKMCMRQCEVCVGGWVAAANGVRACLLTWLARRSVAPSCTARATQACCDPKMEPDLTVKGAALASARARSACGRGAPRALRASLTRSHRETERWGERERERERDLAVTSLGSNVHGGSWRDASAMCRKRALCALFGSRAFGLLYGWC